MRLDRSSKNHAFKFSSIVLGSRPEPVFAANCTDCRYAVDQILRDFTSVDEMHKYSVDSACSFVPDW